MFLLYLILEHVYFYDTMSVFWYCFSCCIKHLLEGQNKSDNTFPFQLSLLKYHISENESFQKMFM